ncbi:restriction endonuclease [Streptococcus mutans]|uniref:restriction endonuclease subunit S n=1 Tax=Streptococcus mutans TaxID=1309 RepID=UPI0002B5F9B8|nr:restriction endonuclease subunit S [Streptococcus mutans]EMC31301.1 restriction enzyme [Streptococcus mutans NLML1]MCB4957180.1 restriction endonuclease subunit S [Streptococcus mutans]MCB5041372.1 restriction endonuclease subunit S [Streptococcus mutans]MCB5050503.1 restriction endonuclease subunit S [Streptococcus mutans]MDT9540203.1 restriction endonuclease subunit S [Streptococcus mutans]
MSKLKLTDVEWGEFKIKDIFEITNSKPYHKQNLKITQRGVPYITRTSFNNGLEEVIEDVGFRKNPKNTITLGAENADFFYQSVEYITGNKMYYIQNENITKNIGLFLVQTFRNSIKDSGFGYGKGLTGTRFKERLVMLPIDSQGQPNWQFMEDYIKQEQKIQAQQVIEYYERKLVELAGDVVGLDKVEWKTFRFTEVFQEIQRGKRLTKANQIDGLKPYVSSTAENNGVDGFIGNDVGVREFENVLTLANSGSVGSTFYQQFEFVASDHVTALKSENADKYAYLFLSTVVKRLEEKYSFNREINDTRIKREKIILPADKHGNPNFQYMSDFVKKLELDKVQEVLEYIYIYIKLKTMLEEKVCEISWKDFWIEDICEIKSGVRLTKANQEIGLRPFVGASDSDNGVTAFVSNTNKSLDANVLGVNYNGSVVENFYHPYEAIFSDDVKRLKWKDEVKGNKYTYLFLKQMILSQKIKYAYGYKFNGERMKRQKIMLPVTETGLPDYDYMTSYMQKQELEQIFKILNYLND